MANDNAQGARPFSLGAASEGIGSDSEVGPGSAGPNAAFPFQGVPSATAQDEQVMSDVNYSAVYGCKMPMAKASSKPGTDSPILT